MHWSLIPKPEELSLIYEIIKNEQSYLLNDQNRGLVFQMTVIISKKYNKDELLSISEQLKNNKEKFVKLYIHYYLKEQNLNYANPYAVANYEGVRNAEILYNGSTAEKDSIIYNNIKKLQYKIIGKWQWVSGGCICVIYLKNNKKYFNTYFKDGGILQDGQIIDMHGFNENNAPCFKYDNPHGEYFAIEANGNLSLYGKNGKFEELTPIN